MRPQMLGGHRVDRIGGSRSGLTLGPRVSSRAPREKAWIMNAPFGSDSVSVVTDPRRTICAQSKAAGSPLVHFVNRSTLIDPVEESALNNADTQLQPDRQRCASLANIV